MRGAGLWLCEHSCISGVESPDHPPCPPLRSSGNPASSLCSAQGSGTPAEKQRNSKGSRLPLPKKIKLFLWVRELAVASWHWRAGSSVSTARVHSLTPSPGHGQPFSLLVIKVSLKKLTLYFLERLWGQEERQLNFKGDFPPSDKLQEELCRRKIPLCYHFHWVLWEDSAFCSQRPMISKASGLLTPHLKSEFQLKSVGSLNRSWEIQYFAEYWPPISVCCLTHKLYLQLLLIFIHWHISGAYRCF